MTTRTRQSMLLGVLAVLLVWLGWQRLVAGGGGGIGGETAAVRGGGTAPAAPDRIAALNVQQLVPATGAFRPGRNIFLFGQPPADEMPLPADGKPDAVAARAGEAAAKPADGQPNPPPVDLRYLGSFGPDDAPIAVFTDGRTITNARQGDVVDGRFVVRRIGYESVDLGFVGFPEDVVHRLGPGG